MFKVKCKLGSPNNIQKTKHTFIKWYIALFCVRVKIKKNEKQQINFLNLEISESIGIIVHMKKKTRLFKAFDECFDSMSARPVQKKASFEMWGGLHVFPLHYL